MIISPSAISPYKIPTFQSGGGVTPFSFGNALKFDGVNDYVSYTDLETNSSYTLSLWINQASVDNLGVLGNPANKTFNFLAIRNNGTILLDANSNRATFSYTSTPNVWQHFVIIYDNSIQEARSFINGVESPSGALSVDASGGVYNSFGTRNLTQYREYKMDEFAYWNTVLTPTDALNLYNSGNGDYATNYSPANLVAYWRCNEADGALTLVDEQGTYNGTLNNFSTPPAYFIPH